MTKQRMNAEKISFKLMKIRNLDKILTSHKMQIGQIL